jgi:hypothetical protein
MQGGLSDLSITFLDDKAEGFVVEGFGIYWLVCVTDDCGITLCECQRDEPSDKCRHPVVCY